MPASPLSTIFYVSRSLTTADEVERIVLVSQRNNELRQISGALLWTGHYFMQVIEGRLPAVVAALRLMSADPRHSNLRVLEQSRIEERRYGPCKMALVVDPSIDALVASLVDNTADAQSFVRLRQRLHAMVDEQYGLGSSPAG